MQTASRPVPLSEVPHLFARLTQGTFIRQFLTTVLQAVPQGGTACELQCGSGYASVWLSQRSVRAEGLDVDGTTIERTRQINDILHGQARFRSGDPFEFFAEDSPRYNVVHHHGLLHRYTVPWIHALLAQQVAMADRVVFGVPSVYLPHDPGLDERLLPLEEWQRILEPFKVLELRYCGDPRHDERDYILCVLQGQQADATLRQMMTVPEEPFPQGISAIVQTRNEQRHIGDCLQTLQGWTDEIIVCDMESSDATVEIASRFTDQIIYHPRLINFDRARNVSAMRARYRWVFYLDADERVPAGMGQQLREMVTADNADFASIATPFRTVFMGRWLQSLYPGYKAPPMYKNGRFFYNTHLHAGAMVDGRVERFPSDNPDLSILHFSYDGLDHYLDKLKRYSTGEALNLDNAGAQFAWQNAVRGFVNDFSLNYDQWDGGRDGGHGFIWSFMCGIYRFMQHAKLYERRFSDGRLQNHESQVPKSVEEVLEYALHVLRQRPAKALAPIRVQRVDTPERPSIFDNAVSKSVATLAHSSAASRTELPASIVYSGPFYSATDYGEESRTFLEAILDTGLPIAAHNLSPSVEVEPPASGIGARLPELLNKSTSPGFLHIIDGAPVAFIRHREAGITIGRTMFETDRLPDQWVRRCNTLDYIWVPSEFNRRTFIQSGIEPEKLRVIPPCLDADFWRDLPETAATEWPFVFVSVFEWSARQGWDVLLRAFITEFKDCDGVLLIINTISPIHDMESVVEMVTVWAREELGHDLELDDRIQFATERMTNEELRAFYSTAHAFVLPARGQGWGGEYLEAMACGLPVIGTNWGGHTEFMHAENSYMVDCDLVAVPPQACREMPQFRGHRWAEPKQWHLQELMRRVYEQRDEAIAVGQKGREYVLEAFNAQRIGGLIREEIAKVQALHNENDRREEVPAISTSTQTVSVRWEGTQFVWHSLAHVNREVCRELLRHSEIELSLIPFEPDQFPADSEPRYRQLEKYQFAALSGPAAIHVRHFYPPRLNPVPEGHLVLMQPWEYGYLPKKWIEPIQNNVSEVWCNSRFERDAFVASGVTERKIQLIPLGVETEIFNPEAPPYVFTTEAGANRLVTSPTSKRSQPFTFLFVGGTLHRKGIDILLRAYLSAFTSYDEVCLVIKDSGTRTIYRGNNQRENILALIGQENRPPIIYLEDDLTAHQLAGLYTACNCLVQPYRGEGFCLPVLEAMACGRAVLATAGGPTDDFVDDTVGWRIPAQQRLVDQQHIGVEEFVAPPWWFEVELGGLVELMRYVYGHRDEVQQRGLAGATRVAQHWTWQQASAAVVNRAKALAELPVVSSASAPMPAVVEADEPNGANENFAGESNATRRQPTVSLCMIVRNEERVLEACLTSVAPWVDEIIVVDTGSTDSTVEIAERLGAKVSHFAWCDDFSRARNESLRHATGDWIFWMDADDTIPEASGRRLRELVFTAADDVGAFMVEVRIPPAPGETGCVVVDHVKLFRNLPEVRFEGRIHEQILESVYRSGGRVERSDVHVVHSGYDYSDEGQERKRERDLLLLQKDLEDRPNHPFVLFNIGMTAYHLKDYDRAVPVLEKCLAVSKPHESTVRKVYAMLAGSHLARHNLAEAKNTVEAGLNLFPHDPELLFRGGIIAREVGDLAAAEAAYLKLLNAPETGHIDSIDVSIRGYKARHNLGLIYRDMGRVEQAETQWKIAIKEAPDFVPSWLALGEIYWQTRQLENLRLIIIKLNAVAPDHAKNLAGKLEAVSNN